MELNISPLKFIVFIRFLDIKPTMKTALWWVANHQNYAIYVSAKQSVAIRWLLEDIAKEFGESLSYRTSELFDKIVRELIRKPRILIVDEIFLLAEMQKEDLKKSLNELVKDGTLKQDLQGFVYIEPIQAIIKDIIKNTNSKKQKTEKFGIFIPKLQEVNRVSFYKLVDEFLNNYTKKFCSSSTLRNYQLLFRNNIIPFFKSIDIEDVNQDIIKEFYLFCEIFNANTI